MSFEGGATTDAVGRVDGYGGEGPHYNTVDNDLVEPECVRTDCFKDEISFD